MSVVLQGGHQSVDKYNVSFFGYLKANKINWYIIIKINLWSLIIYKGYSINLPFSSITLQTLRNYLTTSGTHNFHVYQVFCLLNEVQHSTDTDSLDLIQILSFCLLCMAWTVNNSSTVHNLWLRTVQKLIKKNLWSFKYLLLCGIRKNVSFNNFVGFDIKIIYKHPQDGWPAKVCLYSKFSIASYRIPLKIFLMFLMSFLDRTNVSRFFWAFDKQLPFSLNFFVCYWTTHNSH